MHHGIEILLARMESHPEDFVQGAGGQWLHQIERNKKYFNQEETDKVKEKLRQINLDRMTQNLMEAMVKDEEVKPSKIIGTQSQSKAIHDILAAGLDTAFKDAYANYHPAALEDLEEAKEGEMYKWVPKDYALGFDIEVNKDWKEE